MNHQGSCQSHQCRCNCDLIKKDEKGKNEQCNCVGNCLCDSTTDPSISFSPLKSSLCVGGCQCPFSMGGGAVTCPCGRFIQQQPQISPSFIPACMCNIPTASIAIAKGREGHLCGCGTNCACGCKRQVLISTCSCPCPLTCSCKNKNEKEGEGGREGEKRKENQTEGKEKIKEAELKEKKDKSNNAPSCPIPTTGDCNNSTECCMKK